VEASAQRNLYLALFCAGTLPFMVNGIVNAAIASNPWLYWSFEVACWVVLPLAVFTVACTRGGLRLEDLGIHGRIRGRRNIPLLLFLCLIAGPVDLFIYAHLAGIFSRLVPGVALFAYESVIPAAGVMRFVVAAFFALTAGIVEELYYRGLFFRISEFFPAPRAVYLGVSPVLFALIHWEGAPGNLPATYVFGLLAALFYLALRNLWPLVIGHIYTDLIWFQQ
jgi:hypothetical protein